jgi:hypothetical protein
VEDCGPFDLKVNEVFEVFLIIYKKIHEIKGNEKSRVTGPRDVTTFLEVYPIFSRMIVPLPCGRLKQLDPLRMN